MTISTIVFGKKTAPEAYIALSPEELEKQLNNAKQVELPKRIPSFYTTGAGAVDETFANLSLLDCGDGIWVCCCGHEIPLKHYHGAFPFKHLKCGACAHLVCKRCKTSEILQLVKDDLLELKVDHDVGLLLGQICPSCGLAHRAKLHKKRVQWVPDPSHSHAELCSCGEVAKSDWPKFVIGEVWPYRLNPVKVAHDFKMMIMRRKHPEYRQVDSVQPVQRSVTHAVSQYRPEPQRHFTVVNKPAVPSTISQARRPAALTINSGDLPPQRFEPWCLPATPRSATWNGSEAWVTADDYQQVDDGAESFVKKWIGTVRYNLVKGTSDGELMVQNARRIIHTERLYSLPTEQWTSSWVELFDDADAAFGQSGIDRIEKLVWSRDNEGQGQSPAVVGLPAFPKPGRQRTSPTDKVSEEVESPATPSFADELPATWEFYKPHITGKVKKTPDE